MTPSLVKGGFDEAASTLRQTVESLHRGPEQLTEFNGTLFGELIERITAPDNSHLCFLLYGGISVTEPLKESGV